MFKCLLSCVKLSQLNLLVRLLCLLFFAFPLFPVFLPQFKYIISVSKAGVSVFVANSLSSSFPSLLSPSFSPAPKNFRSPFPVSFPSNSQSYITNSSYSSDGSNSNSCNTSGGSSSCSQESDQSTYSSSNGTASASFTRSSTGTSKQTQ